VKHLQNADLYLKKYIKLLEADEVKTDKDLKGINLIITGNREFSGEKAKEILNTQMNKIKNILKQKGMYIEQVFSGGAKGADTLGENWAISNNIEVQTFEADWDNIVDDITVDGEVYKVKEKEREDGSIINAAAGLARNAQMAENAQAVAIFSLPEGLAKDSGINHMIGIANKKDLLLFSYVVGGTEAYEIKKNDLDTRLQGARKNGKKTAEEKLVNELTKLNSEFSSYTKLKRELDTLEKDPKKNKDAIYSIKQQMNSVTPGITGKSNNEIRFISNKTRENYKLGNSKAERDKKYKDLKKNLTSYLKSMLQISGSGIGEYDEEPGENIIHKSYDDSHRLGITGEYEDLPGYNKKYGDIADKLEYGDDTLNEFIDKLETQEESINPELLDLYFNYIQDYPSVWEEKFSIEDFKSEFKDKIEGTTDEDIEDLYNFYESFYEVYHDISTESILSGQKVAPPEVSENNFIEFNSNLISDEEYDRILENCFETGKNISYWKDLNFFPDIYFGSEKNNLVKEMSNLGSEENLVACDYVEEIKRNKRFYVKFFVNKKKYIILINFIDPVENEVKTTKNLYDIFYRSRELKTRDWAKVSNNQTIELKNEKGTINVLVKEIVLEEIYMGTFNINGSLYELPIGINKLVFTGLKSKNE
jgi:hypothetical protein